jgi:coenzyme F420-reducing hydrogenase alpha subunit
MKKDLHIRIDEVTRVEGHGNIVIDVKKGLVKDVRLEIVESPRFFEVMLRGRRYDEAHHIMSRICGICAVSHTAASLKAVEDAMGMRISPQSRLLRKLAFCGETIQSHILHLYFLVLPDLLGADSIVPLLRSHPEIAREGLKLKRLANEICAVVSGRHIHPISLIPGGVAHTPERGELKRLKKGLEESFDGLDSALELLTSIPVPRYSMPREFISLKARSGYAMYDGAVFSSKGYPIRNDAYTDKIKERVVAHSTAKHARSPKGAFMVGALARFNNGFSRLGPVALLAAKKAGLKPPVNNPFMNNMAQLIECFHLTGEAIAIIERLLDAGPRPEPPARPRAWGRGVGVVEAPRGTLYHEYRVNRHGLIEKADCIIPTAQNLASIEADLRAFVPTVLDRPRDEIAGAVETLVRAYDPCISCSTHIMDVRFA